MDNNLTLFILIVAIVFAAVVLIAALSSRRARLRRTFGAEYERALESHGGDRRAAEAELMRRRERVRRFHIRGLSRGQKRRYLAAWERVQAEFVDDPHAALHDADKLLGDIMQTRGYPVSDFDTQAADLSVAHPKVVENYRAAHDIALRDDRGQAGAEDLRQAMLHCRALFNDLVGAGADWTPAAAR